MGNQKQHMEQHAKTGRMKDGQSFQGIAFAVKNGNETRCEVRGVLPDGERLNGY